MLHALAPASSLCSITPTFAACAVFIDNHRWDGVPFLLKAGKALSTRMAEIRVQVGRGRGRGRGRGGGEAWAGGRVGEKGGGCRDPGAVQVCLPPCGGCAGPGGPPSGWAPACRPRCASLRGARRALGAVASARLLQPPAGVGKALPHRRSSAPPSRPQFRHVPGNLYRNKLGIDLDRATNELVGAGRGGAGRGRGSGVGCRAGVQGGAAGGAVRRIVR